MPKQNKCNIQKWTRNIKKYTKHKNISNTKQIFTPLRNMPKSKEKKKKFSTPYKNVQLKTKRFWNWSKQNINCTKINITDKNASHIGITNTTHKSSTKTTNYIKNKHNTKTYTKHKINTKILPK